MDAQVCLANAYGPGQRRDQAPHGREKIYRFPSTQRRNDRDKTGRLYSREVPQPERKQAYFGGLQWMINNC
jgi:hypothetical protein